MAGTVVTAGMVTGIRVMVMATRDTGTGITRTATIAIMVAIRLTERLITLDDRTTTAVIASTSTVSIITTTNRA